MHTPHVTFLMAAYNAGPYIQTAIMSAIAQVGVAVEVIVVDDGSTDDTVIKVLELIEHAPNVRLLQPGSRLGPSGARNAAIAQARGKWLAVLDADDIILPHRTQQLLDCAHQTGADLVADNLYRFYDGDPETVWPLLPDDEPYQSWRIKLSDWIGRNSMLGGEANLGYVKPMVKADFVRRHKVTYSTEVRIGEDYLFVLSLLVRGAQFSITSQPMYLYRVHSKSLSHQLDVGILHQLLSAQNKIASGLSTEELKSISSSFLHHQRSIYHAGNYENIKRHIRAKDWSSALNLLTGRPSVAIAIARIGLNAIKRKYRIWWFTSARQWFRPARR